MPEHRGAGALAARDETPWLVCFERRPEATLRLICFAHAAGAATAFGTWHRELPRSVELHAVQLPGRESRRHEAPFVEMGALTACLVDVLAGLQDKPMAFFGNSLGSLVAFECARALRRRDLALPVHFFASARGAPQLPLDSPIHQLPDGEFIRELARRFEGIPKVILDDASLLAYFLPLMRADVRLLESYVYQDEAPLELPISAWAGSQDPGVSEAGLAAWRLQTRAAFQQKLFVGGHFYVTSARAQVLAALRESISLLIPPGT